MAPDIVMVGYYGRGNFGDDVLLKSTHSVLCESFPEMTIGVRVANPTEYVAGLLGAGIIQVPFGTRESHQMIVHGGGGNFFDFSCHAQGRRLLNQVLLMAGPWIYVRLEHLARRLARRETLGARVRIGMGLGVGTFEPGSSRLLDALPVLSDFDALWLRDKASQSNLLALGVSPHTVLGSDLAFLHEHWCPPVLVLQPNPARSDFKPRLGVVLRDWPTDSALSYAEHFIPVVQRLSLKFDIHVISLDPATDADVLSTLSHLPVIAWRPDVMTLHDFTGSLASMDVFLTSRAHGAICGAILGRPSVILEIEPKLRAVHEMLPQSSCLLSAQPDAAQVESAVEQVLAFPLESIAADIARNAALSRDGLTEVLRVARDQLN